MAWRSLNTLFDRVKMWTTKQFIHEQRLDGCLHFIGNAFWKCSCFTVFYRSKIPYLIPTEVLNWKQRYTGRRIAILQRKNKKLKFLKRKLWCGNVKRKYSRWKEKCSFHSHGTSMFTLCEFLSPVWLVAKVLIKNTFTSFCFKL